MDVSSVEESSWGGGINGEKIVGSVVGGLEKRKEIS